MDFINVLKAALIGIIEGITEWLPISSTGHMILADELIRLQVTLAFKEIFLVVIQLGAILAVIVLYFHRLNPLSSQKSTLEKKQTLALWGKVLVASLPAAVIGLLFDEPMNRLFYNYQTVAATLVVYGVLFLVVENRNRRFKPKILDCAGFTYQTALGIGAFQVLSLIPGTSRSGATILGAILLGASRTAAAEFSFFLAIPVMFGASALKLFKFGLHFTGEELLILLIGMLFAFAVSMLSIGFLVRFVQKHNFVPFGIYRILLGITVFGYFLLA